MYIYNKYTYIYIWNGPNALSPLRGGRTATLKKPSCGLTVLMK